MITIEVLCESIEDCVKAQEAGAHRIELNNGVLLGGLTPSLGTLLEAKKHVNIPIVTMVRSRTAGFCYDDSSYSQMLLDCEILLKNGADGIVFGFLKSNRQIDENRTREFVKLIKSYGKEAIFHRAFDCVSDPYASIETLIELHVDRILTSGLEATALEGMNLIKDLISKYGDKIEILPGSGIDESNILEIISGTHANQIHGSFKEWVIDPTTSRFNEKQASNKDYFQVDSKHLQRVVSMTKNL